jgi:hypothetical protein
LLCATLVTPDAEQLGSGMSHAEHPGQAYPVSGTGLTDASGADATSEQLQQATLLRQA